MKKTISVTLGGVVYTIEEDAYQALDAYLQSIKRGFANDQSVDELLRDIEASIAEKFAQKLQGRPAAITLADVEEVVAVMGHVDEMMDDKDQSSHTSSDSSSHINDDEKQSSSEQDATQTKKRLYRDPDNQVIEGVCAGLAAYVGVDPVWMRLLFVALAFANGFGILLYLILWVCVPLAETSAQKLEMQGKPINLAEIQELLKKKSADIGREGAAAFEKINHTSFGRRILQLPIAFAGACFGLIKRLWSGLVPLLQTGMGIVLLIGSCVGLFMTTVAASLLAFGLRSPLMNADIPLHDLRGDPLYYVGVGGLYLLFFIPLILFVVAAISLLRRRNVFRWGFVIALVAVWIAVAATTAVTATELAPRIHEQVTRARAQQMATKIMPVEAFESIHASDASVLRVTRGDVASVQVHGQKDALERMDLSVQQGVLLVGQRPWERAWCLFCFPRTSEVEITVPRLTSYTGSESSRASIQGFPSQDLQLTLNDMARANLRLDQGSVTATVRGHGSRLEITGRATSVEAIVFGRGRLNTDSLFAESVRLDLRDQASVFMHGGADRLFAFLRQASRLDAEELPSKDVEIVTADTSHAVVYPTESFTATSTQQGYVLNKHVVTSTVFLLDSGVVESEDDGQVHRLQRP